MKNNGYTLIELIIAMLIASIMFVAIVSGVSSYNKMVNKKLRVAAAQELYSLISYGKEYCKNRDDYGKLVFDRNKNKVILYNNSNNVREVNLDNSLKFGEITGGFTHKISSRGYIEVGTSINIIDSNGGVTIVTVQAGSNYVRIYEEGK